MPASSAPSTSRLAGIWTYLALTFGLSSIFYTLIIRDGHLAAGGGMYVFGLMWCPGVAALITCKLRGRSLKSLGWTWNTRTQALSYAIPIAYAGVAYLMVWLTGLGGFPNHAFLDRMAANVHMTGKPWPLVLATYVAITATLGMIQATVAALGEEIGWHGFLVPELATVTSFTRTALISGAIWTTWHVPILLFADYNSGTPWWYGLSCFAVLVMGISFLFAWMRLRSGSLLPCAFLHASHNLYIQDIFTPLTTDTGPTKYVIDEFGFALAVVAVIVAVLVWRKRGSALVS